MSDELDRLYRRLHPRNSPCPYGKDAELSDLWPRDQDDFERMIKKFYRVHGDPIGRIVRPGDRDT